MEKYSKPIIDILYFDEEDIVTASGDPNKARYSADLMNGYFFEDRKASQTTTVTIQDIKVTAE